MQGVSRSRRVPVGELTAPAFPAASSSQSYLAEEVRSQAVWALLRLHPIFAVRSGEGWSVVAGMRTFRLARAVLAAGEHIPVFEVTARVAELLASADALLTPVLADDLPADRRERWTQTPKEVVSRLVRPSAFTEAVSRFQAPPARTEKRPAVEK